MRVVGTRHYEELRCILSRHRLRSVYPPLPPRAPSWRQLRSRYPAAGARADAPSRRTARRNAERAAAAAAVCAGAALRHRAARGHRTSLPRRAGDRTTRLDALPDEIQLVIFGQLCNALDPRAAVDYSSASKGLRELVQRVGEGASKSPLQQLKEENEAAAALCLKAGVQSCKALLEEKKIWWFNKGLSATDLATLGKLMPVLPALETLHLDERSASAGPDGGQLVEGLGVGTLPASELTLFNVCVGDAGASVLAAALDRGALPRLEDLCLMNAAIGEAGLLALAPALRRRPALKRLGLYGNPFGDEGLAALVAPQPADAPPPQAEVLAKLKDLYLSGTQITDAGCAHLASRLRSGALPALESLYLRRISASEAAIEAVYEARPVPRRQTPAWVGWVLTHLVTHWPG